MLVIVVEVHNNRVYPGRKALEWCQTIAVSVLCIILFLSLFLGTFSAINSCLDCPCGTVTLYCTSTLSSNRVTRSHYDCWKHRMSMNTLNVWTILKTFPVNTELNATLFVNSLEHIKYWTHKQCWHTRNFLSVCRLCNIQSTKASV